ncbi:MAG: glycosyltransferase involved in cell wall biosynthesis [Sphingobacteriales bacterium]|jgi:glycosyltransferase involved in cell wall biosynthesis
MLILSVITVCYNDLPGLTKTVEGYLAQDCCRLVEHIIIDGNSSDGTHPYLQTLNYPNLKWISESDKGLYFAMNTGLEMAQGDYVQFLNAGDIYVNNEVLPEVLAALQDQPDFLYGETIDVDEHGNVLGGKRLAVGVREVNWTLFKTGMRICHQAMFVKRELAALYNTRFQLSADFNWAIHCLKNSQNIKALNSPVIYFEKGGLTQKRRFRSLKERFQIMAMHYGLIPTFLRHLYFPIRAFLFYIKNGWN